MKKIIAFWNTSPYGDQDEVGKLEGAIIIEDDGTLTPWPEDSASMKMMAKYYDEQEIMMDYLNPDKPNYKTFARILEEGENPEDLEDMSGPRKHFIYKYVPGEGPKLEESYTIDENGIWKKDEIASES